MENEKPRNQARKIGVNILELIQIKTIKIQKITKKYIFKK